MIRNSILFAAAIATLAAGSAFAGTQVNGTVSKIDAAQGYVWLDNGVRYDVGSEFAHGILPGNAVSLIVVQNGTAQDVQSAAPAGL